MPQAEAPPLSRSSLFQHRFCRQEKTRVFTANWETRPPIGNRENTFRSKCEPVPRRQQVEQRW